MACPDLIIDLDAIVDNWKSLDRASGSSVETAAVVKADAYGLGASRVVRALGQAGVQTFFVAIAEEGQTVRQAAGSNAEIFVFGGHMDGDASVIADNNLVPLLNSHEQIRRHQTSLPAHPFGLQIDTGMSRLGMSATEFAEIRDMLESRESSLVVSHLACADDDGDDHNQRQLSAFLELTAGLTARLSLSATGGILLGPAYHFDLCRPGIGLYGGAPFDAGKPVVTLEVPVIQARDLSAGDVVGYGATWTATRPSRIATISAGYADGLHRALGGANAISCWVDNKPCPVVGRISMDLITIDITDVDGNPNRVQVLNEHQTIDDLAGAAGTIGYEVLTSLGQRFERKYTGGES